MRQALELIASIVICELVGVIGGLFTAPAIATWYNLLRKPSFNPPAWVFGPVWTALYAMMAAAAWLVWLRAGGRGAAGALAFYGLQLALNVAWSGLFFGLRLPGAAFVEILVLWAAIAATTVAFSRHSAAAAVLMLPYLAWSTFAAFLNFAIWRLNV